MNMSSILSCTLETDSLDPWGSIETRYIHNRRQKLFNRGALRFLGGLYIYAGGVDIIKIEENYTDL